MREENTGLCKRRGETRPMAVGVEVVQPISYCCFFCFEQVLVKGWVAFACV